MKKIIYLLTLILSTTLVFGQNNSQQYNALVKQAKLFYKAKEFKKSALIYSEAFKVNSENGLFYDRYNAACSWALASETDSAFVQLEYITTNVNFTGYKLITTDSDFNSLHSDKRWSPLLEIIKQNKDKAEAKLNKPLVAMLDSIYFDDQHYKLQIEGINKKFGWNSKESIENWKIIKEKDSINIIKVKAFLDKYGWLGADVVGAKGNSVLSFVIYNSNFETQEKYLPMMRDAVKNGRAQGFNLARLEDRVALKNRKKQIYGTSIWLNRETNKHYVSPLEDPDNVDKRRAEMGMQPLAEEVEKWGIIWNVEQYKKALPRLLYKLGWK